MHASRVLALEQELQTKVPPALTFVSEEAALSVVVRVRISVAALLSGPCQIDVLDARGCDS